VLALIAAALSGCGPSPKAAAPQQVAAPPPTAAAPAPPARMMKMVCRNSQTGAKADSGTPNAVMVGMKPA
jgi:hypothetical protein